MNYLNLILIILILILLYIIKHKNKEGFSDTYYPNAYYINLGHRVDRRKNILHQLKKINYPDHKIKRIDAIKHSNGSTGCGLSHIKALKTALRERNGNEYILILEDDFSWKAAPEKVKDILKSIQTTHINWNVILFACNGSSMPYNSYLRKIKSCQTASGYLVKVSYIHQLLKIWERDMKYRLKYNIKKKDPINHSTCIDISWKQLQHNNWFVSRPIIGFQMESYSDIEKTHVNYGL